MARIPTIQRRATLPTTTGVPAAPVVLLDDKTGQSLQGVGQVVSEIGENQLRARADAMVTQSYVNATLKIDELKESIDTNKTLSWEQNDPSAVPPTADPKDVEARMAQIYETASEGLSPYGREKFDKDYSMLSAKGQIEIRREQVARDNAELQAHNLAILDTLVKGSMKDGTEAVWVASLKKGIDSIDSLEGNRQIGPKKAEKLRQEFRTKMEAVKGDRLTVNIELADAEGLRNVDLDEEDDAAQKRLDKLDAAIKEAVDFGAITRTQGTKVRLAFLQKVDSAMAHQQVEDNPAKFLKLEKNYKYLPNLDSKQRSAYAKRAQGKIDSLETKAKTKAKAAEGKFITGAKEIIRALSVEANITPELRAQVNDDVIDANVQDETMREQLKLLVKDAEDFAGVRKSIAGKTPNEIAELEAQLVADTKQKRGTVAQAALAEQDTRQLAIFQQAKAADLRARLADPAQYVVTNNEEVNEAFAIWKQVLSNPNASKNDQAFAYGNYQAARQEAYKQGQFPLDMQKRLPESFVKSQVAFVQEAEGEEIAKRLDAMSEQMGSDWPFMLREMTKAGLSEAAGAIALVENARARDTLAKITQAGGMKELVKPLDSEDVESITRAIDKEIMKIRNVASAGNIYMVNALREAARLLAVNDFAGGTSQGDAVENALKVVVRDNYQVIDHPYLRGIIPVETIEEPQRLVNNLRTWMKEDANLENAVLQMFPGGDDELKREWLRDNARWTFTPDGQQLERRTQNGTPVEHGAGGPFTLPLSTVERLSKRPDSSDRKRFSWF